MTSSTVATQQDQPPTLRQLIENMKPEIARALPRHMNPDRMARIATTVLKQTPGLSRCTADSFLGALMTAAQLGLEPGPLGEAYLVPYGTTATFIPGYRGLVKLAYQSGLVATVAAHVVHANDEFDYNLGLDPRLTHKPTLEADAGEVIAAYAIVRFKDGASNFEVMSVSQIEAIRKRSKASGNGPWVTDWEAMARKTVLKRLSKWMPLSSEFSAAVAHDGTVRTDLGVDLVDVSPDYVDGEVLDQQQAVEPPKDVVYVSNADLAKLKNIRAQEKYDDDATWLKYLTTAVGHPVAADKDLTADEARDIIAAFQGDGS